MRPKTRDVLMQLCRSQLEYVKKTRRHDVKHSIQFRMDYLLRAGLISTKEYLTARDFINEGTAVILD